MGITHDRAEFIAIMHAETPSMPRAAARVIMRAAETLHRIAEEDASDEASHMWNEKRRSICPKCAAECPSDRVYDLTRRRVCPEHRAEKRVHAMCQPYDVVPYFDGDPRGAVVKLRVPSGRSNSFGGNYICVPTRTR